MNRRDPERLRFARQQRCSANEFANDVWQLVRNRRIGGVKFRREHSVGPYTLDFVCLELMLDLEIDGKGHWSNAGRQHDAKRDAYLRRLGFEILRIHGFRVAQDAAGVRQELERAIETRRKALASLSPSPPSPSPRQAGARGAGRGVRFSPPSRGEGSRKGRAAIGELLAACFPAPLSPKLVWGEGLGVRGRD